MPVSSGDVEVLVSLKFVCSKRKVSDLMSVSESLSVNEFVARIFFFFLHKVPELEDCQSLTVHKFHRKFDRFISLRRRATDFLEDGDIFEVQIVAKIQSVQSVDRPSIIMCGIEVLLGFFILAACPSINSEVAVWMTVVVLYACYLNHRIKSLSSVS